MIRGMIFNTEQEKEVWNHQAYLGQLPEGVEEGTTKEWFPSVALTTTTTLTKSEYADLYNIPATITTYDEETLEESTIDNPEYTTLSSTLKVPKWACIVGNALDEVDKEGNVIEAEGVVDISSLIPEEVEN